MAFRLSTRVLGNAIKRTAAPIRSSVLSNVRATNALTSTRDRVPYSPISVQKCYSSTSTDAKPAPKITAPPMVYIAGEEMTHYTMNLIIEKWIDPYFETSSWKHFDLSCVSRDKTDDKVLHDAVEAGKDVGAIFKEPTITPNAVQVKEMGLSKSFGSPNGAMRRGWNGITISRDTIHIDGIELGYQNRVLFERHAVGGEYGAGWNEVGKGTLITNFIPSDGNDPIIVDKREFTDEHNVAVVYHNPYDNIEDLAHYFFKRCLEAKVTPYIVTKKTVFKWQEGFWSTMKKIFDEDYKTAFEEEGLLERSNGDLQHLISDAATMQLIRWTEGGFGMAAHNYDGDMLTDQIAQVHRSPGFITSNLIGKDDQGRIIKEYEASHGTVTDLWLDHLAGKETSLNPLGLVEALIGAMNHASLLQYEADESYKPTHDEILNFTSTLRLALHNTFRYGQGTRDMAGPIGFTTEEFVDKVAWRLGRYLSDEVETEKPPVLEEPDRSYRKEFSNVDMSKLHTMFDKYDKEGTGKIGFKDFTKMLVKMGIAPQKASEAKEPDV